MVILIINGKKQDNVFQNMAQALAFAYQNGECYAAQKVELVCTDKKAEPKKEVVKTNPEHNDGGANSGTKINWGEPLGEMTPEELVSYAKNLGIKVTDTMQWDVILALIIARQNPGGADITLEEMNKEQLLDYANKANIEVNYVLKRDGVFTAIISAILAAHKANNGGN